MERNDLRERALEAIKDVKWMPAWGEERISNMIATRPDWCISRQRVWGVPIIVFYCESCQEPLTDRKVLDRVVELFREHTADVWYDRIGCGVDRAGRRVREVRRAREFRKETDILDVWFDSGVEPPGRAHAGERPALAVRHVPGRRRSVSRLVPQLAAGGRGAERRGAVSRMRHQRLDAGRTRAARCPSRSGIGIEPEEVITKYGADVLRLWAASVDFTEDVRLSETILKRLTEAYASCAITFSATRWAILYDFDPDTDAVLGDKCWKSTNGFCCAEELVAKCRAWYDEFAFHKVYRAVYDFATTDLSAIYVDIAKDRLYTAGAQIALPPRRPDRAVSHHLRAGPPARALLVLHHRRGLGLSAQAGGQPRQRPPGVVAGARTN